MRFLIGLVVTLPLTGCFPAKPLQHAAAVSAVTPVPEPPKVESPVPAVPVNSPQVIDRNISGIDFEGVEFDSRGHHLVVADQPGGPGSRYADSETAARSLGGVAAVNAGFFTPEGAPLGLVASSGKISGSWNTASSLGSGVWYESPTKTMAITRREKLGRSGASTMRELIQAGPLLVENSRPVGGLEATKSSARTVILWDGGTRWWMGCSSPCTLAALGQVLAANSPTGWSIREALNLDGGRSSDLWISNVVTGGPVVRRPLWNRPVRNFLVLCRAGTR
ncbi:MAG: phosphodiester glycosidase family protein [Verrucomicrobiota bacterium]